METKAESMEPLPYYRWLWRDWRANRKVQRMSWQARGLYRELLDEFWAEGSIPEDIASLAEICGCSQAEMEQFWPQIEPCWERVDGGYRNPKMETQRTVKDTERAAKARAGRTGGLACNSRTRAEAPEALAKDVQASARELQAQPDIALALALALAEQEQEQKDMSPSAPHACEKPQSAAANGKQHRKHKNGSSSEKPYDSHFLEAYEAYPKHEEKSASEVEWHEAVARLQQGERDKPPTEKASAVVFLKEAAGDYAAKKKGTEPQHIRSMRRWLSNSTYLDYEPKPKAEFVEVDPEQFWSDRPVQHG